MTYSGNEISVVEDSHGYFADKAKTLDELLDGVEVSAQTKNEAMARAIVGTAREAVLDAIPFGNVVGKILSWNDAVNEEVEQAKRDHLLLSYVNKSEDHTQAIGQIRKLITSPEGNVLFNKILWILDDNPPDPELSDHLAAAMRQIANSDFGHLFGDHKFALGIISRTTPAALSILADADRWPVFTMGFQSTSGGLVTNDWVPDFTGVYARLLGLSAQSSRVGNAVAELRQAGLLEARSRPDPTGPVKTLAGLAWTPVGATVAQYLHRRAPTFT